MIVPLVKVTLLFGAGLLALLLARKSTAAVRHMLCVCTLAGSLLLPVTMLVPTNAIAVRLAPIGIVAAGSRAIARATAWPSASLLLALWLAGCSILLLRLAVGHWRLRQTVRSATPLAAGVYAADVTVPIASGLLRPVVLMPRIAAEWPDWQRAAALRHERAHIERHDLRANFIAQMACALYWFHPLVWLLAALLRREQETACDDAVLRSGFDPATYAEALLAVARNSTSNLLPGCAMTTKIDVKDRILRLLDCSIARTASPATLRVAAIAFAAVVLAIGIPVRADQVYKVGGDVQAPHVVSRVDPTYPEEARHDKIQGAVLLSVVVGTDGMAHEISVIRSLDPGLDRAAAEAVEQWHFAPGTRKGEAVPVKAMIEINFKLR